MITRATDNSRVGLVATYQASAQDGHAHIAATRSIRGTHLRT